MTRPSQDAAPLVKALEQRGVETLVSPMLTISIRPDAELNMDGVQGVLFTSANGVRAFASLTALRDLPIYAVGDRTACAAKQERFENVESAKGDVEKLAHLVMARRAPTDGVLLHPAGTAVAGDLAGRLADAGYVVRRAVIYEAQQATGFSNEIRMALLDRLIDFVLFFSPRSATTFVTLANTAGLGTVCENLEVLCLSKAVATAADPIMWRRVLVAPEPTQVSLLATLDERLSNR